MVALPANDDVRPPAWPDGAAGDRSAADARATSCGPEGSTDGFQPVRDDDRERWERGRS
jgi:hypothetical protein